MRGGARLFKSFEFGNGSRISDENLVILEFKSPEQKLVEHTDYSHFTQITDKN